MNNNSILQCIRKLVGCSPDTQTVFDDDLIIHANTVFANLVQMGIGPEEGFVITDESETWSDFTGDTKLLEQVKTYVCIKVRLLFDPPANSTLLNSYTETARELEQRMYTQCGGY